MGSLMGSFTQQRLGSLSTSWVFLFQSWEISALKMPDSSALCLIFCVENMCCCSVAVSCPALSDPMYYSMPAPLSSTISWSLCQFMSFESVTLFNHLILCHSLLLLSSVFPIIKVFYHESTLHIRWPKYWSFSFSISPSND